MHYLSWASLVAQTVKHPTAMQETRVRSLVREDPLEKEMAIHSSTLAWKIPWTKEPDRLQYMGSQRVGHDWASSLSLSIFPGGSDGKVSAYTGGDRGSITEMERSPGEGNGNPLQYSCLENGLRVLEDYSSWDHKELDMAERLHFHFQSLNNRKNV